MDRRHRNLSPHQDQQLRPDHPEDARGPRVFAYMNDDESRWLSPTERDDIALALRAAFAQA